MTYAGALSFLRRNYSRNLDGVDIAVSGIPFDGAVTKSPGCRFGPRAIRGASTELASLNAFPFGFDIFDTLAVVDYGDCALDPHNPAGIAEAISNHARSILPLTKMLTFGDHFVLSPIRAHAEKHGLSHFVQFDAHCDTWDDGGYTLNHGSMFLHAKKDNLINVDNRIQSGWSYNESDHGFEILTSPWVHRNGIDAARHHSGTSVTRLAISLLISIALIRHLPREPAPVPGGLATWQALELVRGLGPLNMVGFDLAGSFPRL